MNRREFTVGALSVAIAAPIESSDDLLFRDAALYIEQTLTSGRHIGGGTFHLKRGLRFPASDGYGYMQDATIVFDATDECAVWIEDIKRMPLIRNCTFDLTLTGRTHLGESHARS